jgi:hypothetical protein
MTDPPFNAGKAIANDNLDPKAWRAFCNRLALALWTNGAPNVLVETGKDDATMRQELERWLPYRYAVALNYTNSMRNGAVGYANFGLVYWFGEGKCHERYMDRLDAALIKHQGRVHAPNAEDGAALRAVGGDVQPEGRHGSGPVCRQRHHGRGRSAERPAIHRH